MGTRYEDQPPEHWAGPESLDPTPVWKQFIVVGLLLLGAIGLIAVVTVPAVLPSLVTPPAVVPGGRVVLSMGDIPSSLTPRFFGPPFLAVDQSFWIVRPSKDEIVAIREVWSPGGESPCGIGLLSGSRPTEFIWECGGIPYRFGPRGEPLAAPRGLDRYLVSVEGDRLVVNTSHVIYGTDRTPATPTP